MSILPLIMPLFILAIIGWGFAKTNRYLPVGWSKGVNALTARVLVPCLLFLGMYRHGLPGQQSWGILLSFYIALLLLFWFLYFVQSKQKERAPIALAGAFSNLVYVGVPVVSNLFGEQALSYLFPIVAFHSLILFSLYYFADSLGNEGKIQLSVLMKPLKNPIVVSLLLGLIANLIHISLPKMLINTLSMGARAALPCALIVMGASLADISFKHGKWQVVLILVGKLLILPFLVLVLSHFVFAMPIRITSVLVVMASGPVGINAYVVVRSNGGDAPTVSSAILLSCWLSILAWPFWLWVIHQLGTASLGGI
ncbi:AEC family transporter [Celerinatantimonas diazotrophica]|uniref:Malonate transporter n=1 Tax=Celerinatantimonas diazotrophica TaxID=412034 RepID=A0A4R1J7X0_9GAMM|nr:AEC family transporter [Celerinatantimonas diazotrophica]TCK46645.1 hypothetical protein EV690_3230 [Celerinatantimonas diazotrophica]CAG9295347.1 hypothetical protein CEDIAZO_00463 [Celerinatantimonas diazotrophica]